DAVCAESGATIGQSGDGLRVHLQSTVIVEQQDEVVLGAVSLDEGDIGQGGERGIRSAHVTILSVGPARNDTHPIAPGSLKTLFTCELVSDRVRGESVHQLNALSRPGDLSLRSVGESFVGEALE